ncbi:MAG: 30S ribosomal protein S2 [Candidatus Helarchaeota archaeon]|nr:30S ribosomal protein S2 [Candidatus Helarchaeota archaeon]
MSEEKENNLLIPRDQYLAAGIHIGTQIKTRDMIPFIYRITRAGLYVIDIRQTDTRMRIAAKFLSRFDPKKIVIVSARRYGHNPIQQFAHIIGAHAIPGRFVPGTLTNPNARSYLECDLLVIADPRADRQALKEAKIAKIPVISFCDTDNNLSNIDLCVPANNRGRKALALIFWLLTRGALLEKGEIARAEDFNVEASSFQSRGRIYYEATGAQQQILSQLKEKTGEEKPKKELKEEAEKEPEEKPEEKPKEKPKKKLKEKPEKVPEEKPKKKLKEKPKKKLKEKPKKKLKEKPKKKLKEEAEKEPEEELKRIPRDEPEGEVIKPEELIEGPLPEEDPEKKAKKKSEKKNSTKKSKGKSSKSEKQSPEDKTEPDEASKT